MNTHDAKEQAEILALKSIGYLSENETALNALMAQSGLGIEDLRQGVASADFLAGVLDFILQDEGLFLDLCDQIECRPEEIIRARRALPGGDALWDG